MPDTTAAKSSGVVSALGLQTAGGGRAAGISAPDGGLDGVCHRIAVLHVKKGRIVERSARVDGC